MCQHAIQSSIPLTFPYNMEIDQFFQPILEIHKATTMRDVPDTKIVSDDPLPTFTSEDAPKTPSDEEHSNNVMFDDDSTTVGAILILTPFKTL